MRRSPWPSQAVSLICIALFAASVAAAWLVGSADIGPREAWQVLAAVILGDSAARTNDLALARTILIDIRLPRILMGALAGSALGAAGVLSQGLFRNALASPSVIGTTSGGAAAAALSFYWGLAGIHLLALPVAAFVGALAITLVIFFLTSRRLGFSVENLLLVGFAMNALLSAITSLVISLALEDYQRAPAMIDWLLGSLSAKTWEHVAIGLPLVAGGLLLAYRPALKLDVLAFGDEVAASLSVDVSRLRREVIAVISLLVGVTVSLAGALPFVGLIVPHLTRQVAGPGHRRLLLLSMINGMTLVIAADLLARTLRAPSELQVGIVISLIGAPFFLYLLMANHGGTKEGSS